jgi:hypothetical protein
MTEVNVLAFDRVKLAATIQAIYEEIGTRASYLYIYYVPRAPVDPDRQSETDLDRARQTGREKTEGRTE